MNTRPFLSLALTASVLCAATILSLPLAGQDANPPAKQKNKNAGKTKEDAENADESSADKEDFNKYAIYEKTAPRPANATPIDTTLPLKLSKGDRIALIGNTLLDREQHFGQFEALLQQRFPEHALVVRNLAWSADELDLQPRPDNFADTFQHLKHEQADVIFAAYGYNESFAGDGGLEGFAKSLTSYLTNLKSKSFNGKTGARIVFLSPIANENTAAVKAADLNNERIAKYVAVMKQVTSEQKVAFVDLFSPMQKAMADGTTDLTINGAHLNHEGYELMARTIHQQIFGDVPASVNEELRQAIVDKNEEYFRRFRPANTFYYTGGRSKSYGYLDFLPAMRNFDIMVANRDKRIWAIAQGKTVPAKIDDSNVPLLPLASQSRGVNEWMSAADELKSFKVDPRFDVTLFAGEEQFPDIAAPIQMRWDSRGRLWVSCSTTYPHVYPGNKPNDKLVILQDTDGDGKADKSSVFADDLHIPLSFEFGDGGVYVSEMPHVTFLKDTDGDGKADVRKILLTGFGTEDSHHAVHDMTWTPDGDLIWRESIFHHSQVETPYGPVRQRNSGWFRFQPRDQRLTTFGSYPSTNPWGVTFDDWGQHVASHPIYAAAFHAYDPPYPQQHPAPGKLRAYSGTCGQEFVDFKTFPKELQGGFIKVRYKPTNRVEIHKWNEGEFGYDEQYVSDLIFSQNLSFIPVDIRFGPRGDLYVCDWYNPVKGHAQYALRDDRRDRHSGRIWRITTKGLPLQNPPKIAEASIEELLELLKSPESRYRYWAKREMRERAADLVKSALDQWVTKLDRDDARFHHHQIEAVWAYRWIGAVNTTVLRELLGSADHHARAAATQQLRYWHPQLPDAIELLRKSANDANSIVRMEAAIAASYIGSKEALDAMLDIARYPRDGHLAYAFNTALGSRTLRPLWEGNKAYSRVANMIKESKKNDEFKPKAPTATQAQFDTQRDLKTITITCLPERMKFAQERFEVKAGQPVKIIFINADATDHNFVITAPGAMEEVGVAANEMAKDPRNADSDFIPRDKKDLILHHTPMVGPTRAAKVHVLRFTAPKEPGIYPYVCTFPGHWIGMNGEMFVTSDNVSAAALLAARKTPTIVKDWQFADLSKDAANLKDRNISNGMKAFMTARCNQCHAIDGHGATIGPDLTQVSKKYKGERLLKEILEPSTEINEQFRSWQIFTTDGEVVAGVIVKEDAKAVHVAQNLLTPNALTTVPVKQIESRTASKISSMPTGMLNTLKKNDILDLLAFLEAGGFKAPGFEHEHKH